MRFLFFVCQNKHPFAKNLTFSSQKLSQKKLDGTDDLC